MASSDNNPGFLRRIVRALLSPSARWPVLALLVAGGVAGAVTVIGTQVAVHATGTDEFCGGACHSMQWVAKEHKASSHGTNRFGVGAKCADCHIPHAWPEILFYKAKAGMKDAFHEAKGTINTEDKFKKHRLYMAELVWAEYRENDSQHCRSCHVFTPEVLAKQKGGTRKEHEGRFAEKKTCIDCHKGVAHEEPEG